MQQKKPGETVFGDIQSTWQTMMGSFPASMQTLMETQRKNMQAMTEANQQALQGWQALAQRQGEMVSEFLQDNSTLASGVFTESDPAQKMELVKKVCERSMANSKELTEMATKCTKETADMIQKRLIASMNEIKETASRE